MPVLTGPGCTPSVACPATPFPVAIANCNCTTSAGGVNDLYLIPCTETMSETNILDAAGWWSDLLTGGSGGSSAIGNMGKGLGSIAKKSDKKEKLSSCDPEQVVSTTWALKYIFKCFDKSTEKITHQQINALYQKASSYQLIARMCDGDDTVLPVGKITLSDFDWTVPEDALELQTLTIELSWIEAGLPKTYDVAGLSAVIAKAA